VHSTKIEGTYKIKKKSINLNYINYYKPNDERTDWNKYQPKEKYLSYLNKFKILYKEGEGLRQRDWGYSKFELQKDTL
jgi:hypothetical protein